MINAPSLRPYLLMVTEIVSVGIYLSSPGMTNWIQQTQERKENHITEKCTENFVSFPPPHNDEINATNV